MSITSPKKKKKNANENTAGQFHFKESFYAWFLAILRYFKESPCRSGNPQRQFDSKDCKAFYFFLLWLCLSLTDLIIMMKTGSRHVWAHRSGLKKKAYDWIGLRKTFVTARRRLQNESAPGRRRSSWNSPKKTKALDPSYANLIGKKRKCKRYSSRGQVNDYPAAFLPGCLFAGVLGGQKGQKIGSFSGAEVQTERKRWKVLKMKKGCGKKKHFESSENCWHSILSGFFFQGNVYLTCFACCHRYLSCLFPKLPNQFGWLVVAAYFLFPKSLQSTHLSSTRPPKSWMVSSKLARFILLI